MSNMPLESAQEESVEARPKTSRVRRNLNVAYVSAMGAATAGLAYVRLLWQPVMGAAMQNVVTYGIIVLAALASLVWLLVGSPFRRATALKVVGLVAALSVGAVAAIRDVDFDGDMAATVRFRWEPTPEERLLEHRRRQNQEQVLSPLETTAEIDVEDMPAYRGHDRSGTVTGPRLAQDWQSTALRQLWMQPCGGGYSSFAVVGQALVTLEQRGPNEALVCYDASTGIERWVVEYPAAFDETMGGPGPRATPTVENGRVYSLGAEGDLLAVELTTGELIWQVDLLPGESANATWAMAGSPLVVDGLVIVEAGGPAGDGLIAYDEKTGDVRWQRPGAERLVEPEINNRAGYSSPMLVVIDGFPQVLIFDGEGLRSHVPQTGELLWFHEFKTGEAVSVAQPVLLEGNRVFLSVSYAVGCCMIQVSRQDLAWNTTELWSNINMKCKFTSPVLHDGFLYGLDEGILVCLDPATGKRRWKKGRYGHGQILLTNDQLVICTEQGDLVLVAPDPDEFREITRFSALPSRKVWNPHALSRGDRLRP